MYCSAICKNYKAKKPARRDMSRYEDSQKFCSYCSVFMKVDGIRCPCCKKQLKTKTSNNKRLREMTVNRI